MRWYNHAYSRTKSETNAVTDTTTSGTAKSLTEQNSVSKSLASTNGESLQLNYKNRAVKTLLDRIDEQIKRMRSCEDFGMFDTCAYFAASDYDVAVAAASAFKSLTRGENSSIESSAVNIWENEEDVGYIKDLPHPIDSSPATYYNYRYIMIITYKGDVRYAAKGKNYERNDFGRCI